MSSWVLRVDAGVDHRQQGAGQHINAAGYGRFHVIGRRAADYRQCCADQQGHIGAFAKGKVAGDKHQDCGPQQHKGERIDFQVQPDQARQRADDGPAGALYCP